jgi:signal peptidase
MRPTPVLARPLAIVQRWLWALKAAVATLLLTLVLALVAGTAPTAIGFETFVVMSGSMEPALGVGDLAVVGPVKPEQLSLRDIISYRTPAQPNVIVTHRLVGVGVNEAGALMFATKGDANDSVDQVEVNSQAVLGRVFYAVPKIGYLVDFAKRPIGKATLLGLPALLLVGDSLLKRRAVGRQAAPAPTTTPVPTPDLMPASRPSRADVLVRQAWVAQRNGRVAEALALLERAIPLDPSSEDAWLLKAECFERPGDRLTCLWEGLAANPGSASLRAASETAAALLRAAQEAETGPSDAALHPAYDRHGVR